MAKRYLRPSDKGFVSIITVMFVVLMSVVALSFASLSNINAQIANNHVKIAAAKNAAESGLNYAQYMINHYMTYGAYKTDQNVISNDDATEMFASLLTYIQIDMSQNLQLSSDTYLPILSYTINGITVDELKIPEIKFSDNNIISFALSIRQYEDDLSLIEIVSEGRAGQIKRHSQINYRMMKDNRLLEYSVASRSRMIITGDSTIEKGIYTQWSDTGLAAPIELSADSSVNGNINTVVSETDFALENLDGMYDEINYDQPEIDLPTAEDFDTTMYEDMTKTLPNSGERIDEFFPHAEGDYNMPSNTSSIALSRTVYGPENPEDPPLVLTNPKLPAGGNSLFRNCIFEGVLYIGVGNGTGTNNVRFENCEFRGPVITGVPSQFGPETWKKNVLYFTGSNVFANQSLAEATILAPNYNVNLGNTMTVEEGVDNTINGLVIGGVVDVRGNIDVEGTVYSMYMPDSETWGTAASQIATNIGYSDESAESGIPADVGTIHITPNPNNQMPNGIYTKILLDRDGNSYIEW